MNTILIIVLSGLALLAIGLTAIYFLMKHFTEKTTERERRERQAEQEAIMAKIDNVFPTLTELIERGMPQPVHTNSSEEEADKTSRHQSDEDAAIQSQLAEDNGQGAEERQQHRSLFPKPAS